MAERRPFVYTPLAIAAAEGLALGSLSAFGESLPAWRMGVAKLALFATGFAGELFFPEQMSPNINYTLMTTSLFSLTQQLPWALKEKSPTTIFTDVAGEVRSPSRARALAPGCTSCAQNAAAHAGVQARAPYPVGPQNGVTQRPGSLALAAPYPVGPQNGITQHPGTLAWAQGEDWYPALPGPGVGPDLDGTIRRGSVNLESGGLDRSVGREQRPGSLA